MRLGHDVEFILTNKDTHLPISVIGKIGGTKAEPLPVLNGALQEDNVLAEINIEPAFSVEDWENNTLCVIDELQHRLPDGIVISQFSSAEYSSKELAHPLAKIFGCDPDYDAWSMKKNPRVRNKTNLRTAGGHVHIELPIVDFKDQCIFVQLLDSIIGLQTVLLDTDLQRKKLYGKAGAFRPKPYGVEYRVPSNFWVHDPHLREWMFKEADRCRTLYMQGKALEHIIPDAQTIINSNNVEVAQLLVRKIC